MLSLFFALVIVLSPLVALSQTNTTNTTTPVGSMTNTTTTGNAGTNDQQQNQGATDEVLNNFRELLPERSSGLGFKVVVAGIMIVLILYIWFMPPIIGGRASKTKAWAKSVRVSPPRGYDFIVYIVDESDKTVSKDYFVKIGERLFMSTNISKPSYLYVPKHVETYLCKEGKSLVPCGLGHREGLLTILIDPKLASVHDLAIESGLISINENELNKLLSTLYKKGEKKMQEIPISPDTKIGFMFNIKNMIKGYLNILRSADEMMIHFLQTANASENIEKFVRTAVQLQAGKLSWLKYVGWVVMMISLAIGIIIILSGG